MTSKKIAQVLLCRCSKNKNLFGITIEKRNDDNWDMMYSYPIDEERAKSEGFDMTSIVADVYSTASYGGCPFCKQTNFVRCGGCGQISCHTTGNTTNTCGWCGTHMTDIAYRGKMKLKTGED
ncbi:MAG: hypothetical protein IJ666_03360 [Ruminococcus sp.]|nr:hypothetical protein [Ruminococcus sp.]